MIPKIKICGLTKAGEAELLNEVRADYAGFVLYEKSKRHVNIPRAEEIRRHLSPEILTVAVAVSPDMELIRQIEDSGFDLLQIHGVLREEVLNQCRLPLWRACNLDGKTDMEELQSLNRQKIAGYLADAKCAGSGRTFDWQGTRKILRKARKTYLAGKTFLLAGGLNPQNVAEGIALFEPDVVDVSSGVEGPEGKERALILSFAGKVRGHE